MILRLSIDRAEVRIRAHADARVRDLAHALSVRGLWCGTRPVPDDEPVHALAPGASLTTTPRALSPPLSSGGAAPPDTSPSRHASAQPEIGVAAVTPRAGPDSSWRRIVARRPVTPPCPRRPTLRPPPQPPPPQPHDAPLSWTAATVPVVVGVVLAVLFDPRLALFALLTPAMVIGQWGEQRVRRRRDRRRHEHATTAWHETLSTIAADAATSHAAALARAHPPASRVAAHLVRDASNVWRARLRTGAPLTVRVGRAMQVLVDVPDDLDAPARLAAQSAATLEAACELDLLEGLAVVGPAPSRRAVIRAVLLQCAARYAPSELRIHVLSGLTGADSWIRWLPHADVIGHDGDPGAADDLAGALMEGRDARVPVVVLDEVDPLAHPRLHAAVARGGVALVVAHADAGVAGGTAATTVRLVDATSSPSQAFLDGPAGHTSIVPDSLTPREAYEAARSLAGVRDPGADRERSSSPVGLLELWPEDAAEPAAIRRRWSAGSLDIPLGVSSGRIASVDLRRDGPHALVAGTTGAGKSELLRTMLCSAALAAGPDRLTWILIDYKGGAAFAGLADLPHTVGLVTDLDEHLASRALRCLRAELRRREELLRAAGVAEVDEEGSGMPARLLIVVDEFAALAAELPGFVDALVDVAQRGRSLGLHLVLATQRPGGVVSAAMQANLNLRVALRTQSRQESSDVIGVPDAADLDRHQPGAAIVRLGAGDRRPLRVATCSDRSMPPRAVEILGSGTDSAETGDPSSGRPDPAASAPPSGDHEPSDLARIVTAVREAAAGLPAPACPWPPPLPPTITAAAIRREHLAAAPAHGRRSGVVLGLRDEPDRQRQAPLLWEPADGRLAVVGRALGGTTDALSAVAAQLLDHPEPCHVHAVDAGGGLGRLGGAAGVGAVVALRDRGRLARLARHLGAELDRRLRGGTGPRTALVVDRFDLLRDALDDADGWRLLQTLTRVATDGPPLGITAALGAPRPGALPAEILAAPGPTLCLDLGSPYEHTLLGLQDPPPEHPGRAVDVATGCEVQLVSDDDAQWARLEDRPAALQPPRLEALPTRVSLHLARTAATLEVRSDSRSPDAPLRLRVGLDDDHQPADLVLRRGDHGLVVGPARSGKSTTLATVAAGARAAGARVCWDVANAGSSGSGRPTVVLVDDVDLLDDHDELHRLLRARRPDIHVVAAGRVDVLRRTFAPWLRELTRTRIGLALCPDPANDGAPWELPLPRIHDRMVPGRGVLLDAGVPRIVQVAIDEEAAVA